MSRSEAGKKFETMTLNYQCHENCTALCIKCPDSNNCVNAEKKIFKRLIPENKEAENEETENEEA